jgi:hypothetical protein
MANVQNYYYEVDENNAVRIWDSNVVRDGGNPPQIFQPDYPSGNPFEDAAAAAAWAEEYLNGVIERRQLIVEEEETND